MGRCQQVVALRAGAGETVEGARVDRGGGAGPRVP